MKIFELQKTNQCNIFFFVNNKRFLVLGRSESVVSSLTLMDCDELPVLIGCAGPSVFLVKKLNMPPGGIESIPLSR
jgi:hypothetical protein